MSMLATITRALVMALSIALGSATQAGCTPEQLAALTKVAQGSQYLGTLISVAETGSRLFFDRHPNMEAEQQVKQRIKEARLAQSALDASLAVTHSAGSGDAAKARADAVRAYGALRDLLLELGIPQAVPPAGGPETDAPSPTPFEMPEPSKVEALLSA